MKSSEENLKSVVPIATTWAEVLRAIGMSSSGASLRAIKAKCERLEIDTSHIVKGVNRTPQKIGLQDILNGTVQYRGGNQKLKDRIVSAQIFEDICSECQQTSEWNGKPLVLQLDHIDGNSTNNKLNNLRILCPNCHTQTATFAGKQLRKSQHKCMDCDCPLANRRSKRCFQCNRVAQWGVNKKTEWPDIETLIDELNRTSLRAVGERLGLSGAAVRSHLLKRNCSYDGVWKVL